MLAEGFSEDEPLFSSEDKLDDRLDPAEIIQVIDADASQTKVIEEVRSGSNLVVQGPPGTGKSQTITNIIAAATHDGKSVLFVAEKMAALSVVHDRLVRAGLRDICLELHSRTANKKALTKELERTLLTSTKEMPSAKDPVQLRETRNELNRITKLLHKPIAGGSDTPFQAISEIIGFIGQGVAPPKIDLAGLKKFNPKERLAASKAIDDLVEALERSGPPDTHPFYGTSALDLQPTDLSRLESELREAITDLDMLIEKTGHIASSIHQQPPRTFNDVRQICSALTILSTAPSEAASLVSVLFDYAGKKRLSEALEAGIVWAEAREKCAQNFIEAAWQTNVTILRTEVVKGQVSWLSRIFGKYRRASADLAGILSIPLPKSPSERLNLIDELLHVQRLRQTLSNEEAWLGKVLGSEWRGERTPFSAILSVARWLKNVRKNAVFSSAGEISDVLGSIDELAAISVALSEQIEQVQVSCNAPIDRLCLDLSQAVVASDLEDAPLVKLSSAFTQMNTNLPRYNDWANRAQAIKLTRRRGAGSIVEAILAGRLEPNKAKTEFTYACAEARWNAVRKARPKLKELPEIDRDDLVHLFRRHETERIEAVKNLILSRHFKQMPRGRMDQMGIIHGEIGRKRGHKPIRWVMERAGSMVQRIKPVMLMSPISVAQFLPPDSVTFDLLVIDEASQVRPEEAIGVIARARQIVVVGDQKQLPPTSFFERLIDEVEDNDDDEEGEIIGASVADMESILSLCEARGIRQQMLKWHYRSRDPSLIHISNAEFYDNGLVLPPSPLQDDQDYGLKFRHVPGVYVRGSNSPGRQGTNRIEAEEVVQAMAEHARVCPDLSLGIVTFSKAQAEMLTEVLEIQRRQDHDLDAFLREGKAEDVFVKNIENVQGDERDVIMISVGYGPQEPNGRLASMSFGPINGEGGERRLNVLFSRARVRCEVFASFDPEDIDPSRSSREGPRVLKRFLDFAKTGIMEIETPTPTGLDAESPFEEDVAWVIESLGYRADPQVGTEGFRIDIGVRHPDRPNQYLVAVECDGATYHGTSWARERDRLRQDILENLGWRFHRIWSTAWFNNRAREIEKLEGALKEAYSSSSDGLRIKGSNADASVPKVQETEA